MENAMNSASLVHYDARRIAHITHYPDLIEHLATAHCSPAVAPIRLGARNDRNLEMLVMPVVSPSHAGAKILVMQPQNTERNLPVINGLFVLFDGVHGLPLATMDASELTACRTAAVSALASRHLSRPEASTMLIIGSGHLAPYLAEAHAAVRPISHIQVWARNRAKAELCAQRIANRLPTCQIAVTENVDEAMAAADIISCATRSAKPIVKGALLRPGTHVDAVGGYRPDMREVDDETVRRARIFVDNREAVLAEAGDLISPLERGVISENAILGDLSAMVTGTARTTPEQITLFKSVGSAISDLAAAELFWQSRDG